MSEHAYLREQSIGTQFSGVYYVSAVSIKKTKTNTEYSEFTLKDKSGTAFAKLWSVDPAIKKGLYVSAVINVDDYQGVASYIVRSIKVYDKEVDISKYVPVAENMTGLKEKFDAYVNIIKDTSETKKLPLFAILSSVFTDQFKEKFFNAPSSLGTYYGKVGGALENTINICRNVMSSAQVYDFCEVEQAVLLTSALLSRVGSVNSFEMNNCAVEKTLNGSLVGVQTSSSIILHDAWKKMKTEPESEQWFVKVFHAVTSADGTENVPCTKEAILLKSVISIDSTMVDMFDYISRDEHVEDGFTTFDATSKRRYFVGK